MDQNGKIEDDAEKIQALLAKNEFGVGKKYERPKKNRFRTDFQ